MYHVLVRVLKGQIEFESGSNTSMSARLLAYNAILYHAHELPVISIIVYPFRTKLAESPLEIRTKRNEILTFHFQVLPLFTLEAEQFVQNHIACMYPLLPTMRGTNYQLIQQVLDELTELYREDEVKLSQQLIWMEVLLARTDMVPQVEKHKIQERLSMYDQLWEENPKIRKIRAESKAEGIAEGIVEGEARGLAEGEAKGEAKGLQTALVTTVQIRFPALSELAERQVKQITKPDMLTLLLRQITIASDEDFVRQVLKLSAA